MAGLVSNVFAAAGFILLTVGAWMIAPAAGVLVAGLLCFLISGLVSR